MFCVMKESTQNEKVTASVGLNTRAVNNFKRQRLPMHRHRRVVVCESTLPSFKWFHYFLNPFWI